MPATTDPEIRSFVPVSSDSHFPIQNLPYGVFRPRGEEQPRVGVAIGEVVLDLAVLDRRGLLKPTQRVADGVFRRSSLNAFMALGRETWTRTRQRISELLRDDCPTLRDDESLRRQALVPLDRIELLLPVEIGDYTDFYSSREHATNVGSLFRPDDPLLPNWLHMPVAYHGRASSVVVSGTDFRRPWGQRMVDGATAPVFGPSRLVDFELEMGFLIGTGSPLGESVSTDRALQHVFGLVLVNDWSARDIQKWEYAPLGPFLSKNFATSISPWIVTLDALEPFQTAGPQQQPAPLSYLSTDGNPTYDVRLEVGLQSSLMPEPETICRSNLRYLYWNIRQQVAHHTVTGCNLRTGDLLATGTISGPHLDSRACLLELTRAGQMPHQLKNGEVRRFLEDGDRVTMTGDCEGDGYRVGFGEVTGKLLPARQ